jgi:murein DD-endopeptidase MepM/ murein hydrolase activator NlpD
VGYAGTTGWSTACHLHFTVMVNGQAVDPQGWF